MEDILAFNDEVVKQIQQLFQTFQPDVKTTFDEIETTVRDVMLKIGRQTVERIMNSRGTGYAGKEIETPSGERAEYVEDRERTIKTLLGEVTIRRAYYRKDRGGYMPLDESPSIPKERYSYAAQEAMSLFSIEDSFGESEKKLSRMFPINASGSTIRRITLKHGEEITREERAEVKAVFSYQKEAPEPEVNPRVRGDWLCRNGWGHGAN